MRQLAAAGVKRVRFWLDQCVRQDKSNKRSWAHTGILPYAICPVASLGVKRHHYTDRNFENEKRFWLFAEEVCGLWEAGLIIMRYMNQPGTQHPDVQIYPDLDLKYSIAHSSLNLQEELSPHESIEMLFRNLLHCAADHLDSACLEDKQVLKNMARINIFYGLDNKHGNRFYTLVGSDWKL